jgi:hypothetical protein
MMMTQLVRSCGTANPGDSQAATRSASNLKIDHSPTPKLRAAKKVWRSFHPDCAVSGGRIISEGLSFWSTRVLGPGVEVSWSVRVWKDDETSCALQILMGLSDERVNALRSIALGFAVSGRFLDFDVLAASSVMNAQEVPDYPLFDSNASVEEFAAVVGDYSRRIDDIWSFAGGFTLPGLERLAVWALRNEGAETSHHPLHGGICAAFAYGESELANELIAEFVSQWKERMRLEPSDSVLKIYNNVRQGLERLQEAIRNTSRFR